MIFCFWGWWNMDHNLKIVVFVYPLVAPGAFCRLSFNGRAALLCFSLSPHFPLNDLNMGTLFATNT